MILSIHIYLLSWNASLWFWVDGFLSVLWKDLGVGRCAPRNPFTERIEKPVWKSGPPLSQLSELTFLGIESQMHGFIVWNSLPPSSPSIVQAPNNNCFKNRFDKFWEQHNMFPIDSYPDWFSVYAYCIYIHVYQICYPPWVIWFGLSWFE